MGIKKFVADVLNDLKELPNDNRSLHPMICIESEFSYQSLINFLNDFSNTPEEAFNHQKILQCFCDFLSDRWLGIRHTDSAYPYQQGTRANRAYLIFAEHIAHYFLPYFTLRSYDLVMPSVASGVYKLSRRHLNDFCWHEFIISDDGTPIEIEKCLEDALWNRTSFLAHTGLDSKPLNDQESNRVIHHSEETENYYQAMQFYFQSGIDKDLNVARKRLHEALQENDLYVVKSNHGIEGQKKLFKYILSYIKDKNEFTELMTRGIPANEWHEWMQCIHKEDLVNFFLNEENSFINTVQRKQNYTGDEKHDRAILYCLSEIYRREKSNLESTSTGMIGYFSCFNKEYIGEYRKYVGGYTNAEKQAAVTLYQAFLRSQLPLNAFETFLDQNQINNKQRGPCYELGSQLSFLIEQTSLVGDPSYFQKGSTSFFRMFGF